MAFGLSGATKKRRSDLAHLWANGLDLPKKMPAGMVATADKIYSYGTHFCIAVRLVEKGKVTIVLTTDKYLMSNKNGYSMHTEQHKHLVQQACSHLNVVYCSDVEEAVNGRHEHNLRAFDSACEEHARKLMKAKKPEMYYEAIAKQRTLLEAYRKAFKVTKKYVKELKLEYVFITPSGKELETFKKNEAKRMELAEAEKARQIEQDKQDIIEWKAFAEYENGRLKPAPNLYYDKHTYLRYFDGLGADNKIETSKGIELPIDVAQRFYKWLKGVVKNGGCDGNCNKEILGYSVKEVNAEHIVIGCHDITWEEINGIANQLDWK